MAGPPRRLLELFAGRDPRLRREPDAPSRRYLGAVYPPTAEYLRAREVWPEVLGRASPGTVQVLRSAPFPFAWSDPAPLDEIESILLAMPEGAALCAGLGLFVARRLAGNVLHSVLHGAFALFGTRPESVFARLDLVYALVAAGNTFELSQPEPGVASLEHRAAGTSVPEALFHVTRGNLLHVFDLCAVDGEIDPPQLAAADPDAVRARYSLRWRPR